MLECTTEQSWGNYRWTFDRMLPALPGLGTPLFARLVRDLQPYGISPSGIFIEAPTTLLADVNLRIFLLEGQRAQLRISYSFFEFTIDYLSEGDEVSLPRILNAVFHVLQELDADSKLGRAQFTLRAHLSLQSGDRDSFLAEHIKPPANQERLLPDLVYYKVRSGEESGGDMMAAQMRIGVTKSLLFEKALFVELIAEYHGPPEPEEAGERFAQDAKTAFELVGLNPKSKGKK